MKAQELLFAMLRSVICGEKTNEEYISAATPELVEEAFALATRHDLGHLVGQAVSDWKLPESPPVTAAKQAAMQALYRQLQMDRAYHLLCKTLEEGEIPFISLKGAVLRNDYPQPWMRTSCDIDILVKPSDLDRARELLETRLSYRYVATGSHDVSLDSPAGVHLELHFDTIESFVSEKAQQIMASVWEDTAPVAEKQFMRAMSDELFYFYHIAHMAKHLVHGGCGIRPFLDLWILDHKFPHNGEKRDVLLAAGGLLPFTEAARRLSRIWFSGEEMEEMSARMESFLLEGGSFGSAKTRTTVRQTKAGGRGKYILSRLFLPYHDLKVEFPVLDKHKWLLPACQVIRWCRVPFGDARKRTAVELRNSKAAAKEGMDSTAELLRYLGLDN